MKYYKIMWRHDTITYYRVLSNSHYEHFHYDTWYRGWGNNWDRLVEEVRRKTQVVEVSQLEVLIVLGREAIELPTI